jgi:acyl-Coa thioesterase superfamily protein/acyl-CoA thioesterase superfamily protein
MSTAAGSFYVPLAKGRFRSTELTAGPWSTDAQHGGPPAALLARTIEAGVDAEAGPSGIFARLTFEILGPIPVGVLSVRTKTIRPGRRISLREAVLMDERDRPVMLCRAWRIATTDKLALPQDPKGAGGALPGPAEGGEEPFFDAAPEVGYHHGIEARFVRGSWREPGPAAAWIRMRVPLLSGEEPSPLVRVLVVADSGNGVGGALDTSAWTFVNPETTVHLHAYPRGEWVGLKSSAAVEAHGVGLTSTTIHDEGGPIGSAAQALLVAPR